MLKIGQKAPEFMAADQAGQNHQLSDYKGKWVLLYFYPRDNTPAARPRPAPCATIMMISKN